MATKEAEKSVTRTAKPKQRVLEKRGQVGSGRGEAESRVAEKKKPVLDEGRKEEPDGGVDQGRS